MYLTSNCAGYGRNFWASVSNGTITVHNKDEHLYVKVREGLIVEETRRSKDECTVLKYGHQSRTTKGAKTIRERFFEHGTLRAIRKGGLWKRDTDIRLCGSAGTLKCYSTSSGAYGKEVFTYSNGVRGYIATRWRKKLLVRRPNGKLWLVLKGKVVLNWEPIAEKLNFDGTIPDLWRAMRGQDWEVTVYDKSGVKVITQGCVKNRQKEGRWLQDGKVFYYMSGVQVSQQLYEDDPSKWDGHEVLKIPNAQLRCSLLNRMGYDKLLGKVRHQVIDQSSDGGQLLKINTHPVENMRRVDNIMKMLKVICPSTGQTYVLRVPPDMESYDQARQWTFGLQEQNIREGAHLELVKET
jgi:hypothetical protein